MRIYGREKSAVVNATKAVSATRNTLNGSTKNCSSNATIVPSDTTRLVRSAAATKVARLIAAFSSAAQRLWPNRPSSTPPASGRPRTSAISCMSVLLELLHVADVEAVELLADMKEKYSEDEGADQHVERDAELDHERHSIGGARGGEEQPVFHGEEPDDLRNGLAAHDHHEERKQHA